jgi:two-component system, OmpR family, sensor kinase
MTSDRPDGVEPTFAAPEAPSAASAAAVPPSGTDVPGTTAEPAPGGQVEAGPGATAESVPGEPEERRWGWFARVPLRVRLVAIIVLLLGAGMVIAGLTTRTVVSNYLVDQLDTQLVQGAHGVSDLVGSDAAGPRVPTEYVVVLRDAVGETHPAKAWPQTEELYGSPEIPSETVDEALDRGTTPFTAASIGGEEPTDWRIVSVPVWVDAGDGPQQGVAYVARPLDEVEKTVSFLSRSLIWSGIGIVLLGGTLALWLVQHSLRPLRRIEATAAAIAEGDLSRRVPEQPPSTEVGSLSHSLNVMLTQIESAFAVQEASEQRMRRFVSDASHELRTPLATVRGYGELYRMGALDTEDKVDDTMVRIEDSARRMGTLVNDLLVLARLDESRPMKRDVVDLADLARETAQDLHALDPTRTVTVTGLRPGEAPPSTLRTVGDADRLRQVLTNLVGNVARHTPAGSPAELALGAAADGVVVEVRDHGPGVSAEQADRIFERFYRADSSRNRESGGSGLGLAIVAAILGAHGGRAAVTETSGGGLTVRVLLPAADDYAA